MTTPIQTILILKKVFKRLYLKNYYTLRKKIRMQVLLISINHFIFFVKFLIVFKILKKQKQK